MFLEHLLCAGTVLGIGHTAKNQAEKEDLTSQSIHFSDGCRQGEHVSQMQSMPYDDSAIEKNRDDKECGCGWDCNFT